MRRAAPRRRTLLKGLLGQKQLSQSQLVKKALLKVVRREVLSAAQAEAVTATLKRAAVRGVVLKLALPRRAPLRDAAVNPVMLSVVRDSRQLAPLRLTVRRAALAKATLARRAPLRAAPVNLALVRPAPLRDAMDRVAAPKPVTLRVPVPLALPGALGLVGSSKIRVNRRKAPPVNAALMRLVRVPRARNRRHPSGVVHPLIAPRSRRASQWTRHLKPP